MNYSPFALLTIFIVVVALYYFALARRSDWNVTPFQKKMEMFLSPLPILVGLIGVAIGYQASNQATISPHEELKAKT